MADQTMNALLGISKTLTDIVAPAIREDDPLAQQELRMVVRYLDFLRERVEHVYARARFELQFQKELAIAVTERLRDSGAASTGAVDEMVEHGELLLATPGAPIKEIRHCAALLAVSTSDAVRNTEGDTLRGEVETAVVATSERMTAFERSWYFPLGLDHYASEVAPLDSFLTSPAVSSRGDVSSAR